MTPYNGLTVRALIDPLYGPRPTWRDADSPLFDEIAAGMRADDTQPLRVVA